MRKRNRRPIPIQIIGTQRSGSNLLRLIMNQSQDISAHHPPHILTVFFPILYKYGDLTQIANFERLTDDVCRLIEVNPVKWGIHFSRNAIIDRCEQRTLVEIFKVVYEMMAEKDHATYWCCKSMANVQFFEDLEHNGMKPYYIHLIRDGRDVATSFKKTLVGEKHAYHLAKIWKENIIKAKQVFNTVSEQRCLTIRYETLISNPEQVLENLNTFLGIHLGSSSLNYFNSKESKKTAAAGFMWSNLTKPILRDNTGKFAEEMDKEEIEIFERVAGDVLEENGYSLYSKGNPNRFSQEEINEFDLINEKSKKEVLTSPHLKADKEFRIDRKRLLEELNS